jgi:hypothetical protein
LKRFNTGEPRINDSSVAAITFRIGDQATALNGNSRFFAAGGWRQDAARVFRERVRAFRKGVNALRQGETGLRKGEIGLLHGETGLRNGATG